MHDPELRVVTFSGLIKLQSEGLKEQLRLRSVVDNRREDNGRALVLVPPTGERGRSWLVLKLQSLLKKEFAERKIDKDPDDLEEGDRGLESHAARAPRQSRAQKAAPSDGDEAAASKEKSSRGRKRKAVEPEWEEDDELGESWPAEHLFDKRIMTTDYKKPSKRRWPVGTELYLVAWRGYGRRQLVGAVRLHQQ